MDFHTIIQVRKHIKHQYHLYKDLLNIFNSELFSGMYQPFYKLADFLDRYS